MEIHHGKLLILTLLLVQQLWPIHLTPQSYKTAIEKIIEKIFNFENFDKTEITKQKYNNQKFSKKSRISIKK